ncbi:hypothetical protein LCGC14_2002290 [marine sediment metagenome]|uniref:Uncharacterized protein n=1 Tax=marine sediment metagenome TaxID=412755 RepID=A0A0F9F2R3_9ZZZZ
MKDKKACKCGCCHTPDHGACPISIYEEGMNGRCVYCDHGKKCHNEEYPTSYNNPLENVMVERKPYTEILNKKI